jgi:hypothetical protein
VTPALLLDGVLRSAALQPDAQRRAARAGPAGARAGRALRRGQRPRPHRPHGGLEVRFRVDGPIASGPGGRYEVSADGALVLTADDARGYVKSVVAPPAEAAPEAQVERLTLGLSTHPWLAEAARFDGDPVLPGSFQLELAASAVLRRNPAARVVAVEGVRFERLLRLRPDRAHEVSLALERRDATRTDVTLLARHPVEGEGDLRLSRMTVVLGDAFEAAPAPLAQGPSLPEPHVPAALYLPASRLHLGGVFAVVRDARTDGEVLTAGSARSPPCPRP